MPPSLLFAMAWYVTGVGGFLWWWTEELPVDRLALWEACMAGLLGPLTLLLGICVHRLDRDDAPPVLTSSRSVAAELGPCSFVPKPTAHHPR